MIFRKDNDGNLIPIANSIIQRFNDRIFTTTHSVEEGVDYYDIDPPANKYITGLTDFTEFQLYIPEPNSTADVKIRFNEEVLTLNIDGNTVIPIGSFNKYQNLYTLNDGFAHSDTSALVPEAVVRAIVTDEVKIDNVTVTKNIDNEMQAIGVVAVAPELEITHLTGADLAEALTMEWDI